ncbi:hypothetical protein [Paenibacillus sp. MBLB4367]|uniref:hypothetical protein n=1 Tax=Paenibacillus sp. MBLB4367 TaxID=3384767 RepID=UPI00390837CA
MKAVKLVVAILCVAAVLAACSSKSVSTTDGAKNMQATLTQMQKNVEANDKAKVKENAEALEKEWQKFEDDVKDKQADVYGKVEDPLGAIQTGAKQASLDQAAMKDQISKLNEALKQVK